MASNNQLPLTRAELSQFLGDDQDLIIRFEELFTVSFTGTPSDLALLFGLIGAQDQEIIDLENDVADLEVSDFAQWQNITTLFTNLGQLQTDYNQLKQDHDQLRTDFNILDGKHTQLQSDHNQLQAAHNQLILRVLALEGKFTGTVSTQIDTTTPKIIDVSDGLITQVT